MRQFEVRTFKVWQYGLLMLLTAWMLLVSLPAAAFLSNEEFLPPEQAFKFSAEMTAPDTLELVYKIAPKYYMYRERFEFSVDPDNAVTVGSPQLPQGKVTYDPTFEKNMEVYYGSVAISLSLKGDQPFTFRVTSQGCADAGLCYPPEDHTLNLSPIAGGGFALAKMAPQKATAGLVTAPLAVAPVSTSSTSADSATGLGSLLLAGDIGLADAMSDMGWLKTAGVFLVLGLLLALTPCVLPMIPILSSIVVGASRGAPQSRWRGFGLAAAYVLGMSVVYTALGVAAGLSGAGLAAWLQTPWILSLFAGILILLAIATFGAFDFQVPGAMQSWLSTRVSRIPGGRVTGALGMGAISALIVGPCVAAPLAGALLYISQTGDVVLGGAALFALAWGMGVPLLVVGASSGALLPKAGAWMNGIKQLFGMLLLATAWWMLTPVVPAWMQLIGWAFLAMVSAVMLRAFDALPNESGVLRVFAKGLGVMLALVAAIWFVGAVSGGRDVLQPLSHWTQRTEVVSAQALPESTTFLRVRNNAELDAVLAQSTRPVMLDFYADWCVSCIEMERFTFSDPAVKSKMSRMLLVQVDATKNTEDDRALFARFKLFGPPAILFFAPGGAPIPDARVVGFQNAERFGAVLDRVLK
jgi:thiol:disulfide interchange protein DsbD